MPKAATDPAQCRGTNAAGKPCSARAQPGRAWCQWHDPAREAERAQWRSQGGKARSTRNTAARELKRYPTDMGSLRGTLFHVLKRVEGGDLEPKRYAAYRPSKRHSGPLPSRAQPHRLTWTP
ncbi:MAG: hypothetical protein ACR2OE_02820 [Thermomicrobiales bacterium]